MIARKGDVGLVYRCACGSTIVRVDAAPNVLRCYDCKGWAKPTGRRVVLGPDGAVPCLS